MVKQRVFIPPPELTPEELRLAHLLQNHLQYMPPGPFKPVAFYRPKLDQIEVIIRDCSTTHRKINGILTIMEDNYPEPAEDVHVGFVIDCAHSFCTTYGLIRDDQVSLPEVVDALFNKAPGFFAGIDEIRYYSEIIGKILGELKIKVLRLV